MLCHVHLHWKIQVREESTGPEPALPALPGHTTPGNSLEEQLVPESTNERDEKQPLVPEDPQEEREAEESVTVQKTRANERGTFGVDFAQQTDDRQTSLDDRKKQMLQNARR